MIYVNINRAKLAANSKLPMRKRQPAISVRSGQHGKARYGKQIIFGGPVILFQNEEKPLKCGARVWIETEHPVLIDGDFTNEADLKKLNRKRA